MVERVAPGIILIISLDGQILLLNIVYKQSSLQRKFVFSHLNMFRTYIFVKVHAKCNGTCIAQIMWILQSLIILFLSFQEN